MRIRLTRRSLIIALLALLAYPAIANVMILTGAAKVLANIKPQKLTMSWESAWTLLPGRFVVSGLEFQSTTPRNQFSMVVDTGKVSVSIFGLLSRTVAITQAEAAGVEVRARSAAGDIVRAHAQPGPRDARAARGGGGGGPALPEGAGAGTGGGKGGAGEG